MDKFSTLTIVTDNKELSKRMNLIQNEMNKVLKSANTIGKALSEIKAKDLWKDTYKSFEECAGVFGIKKAQAYNLIKGYEIGEKALVDNGKTKLCTLFSNTQCVELCKLEKEEGEKGIVIAINNGMVKPDMSTKELRLAIDKHLNPEKYVEKEDVEEVEEVEEDNTPFAKTLTITLTDNDIIVTDNIGLSANDVDKLRELLKKYIPE